MELQIDEQENKTMLSRQTDNTMHRIRRRHERAIGQFGRGQAAVEMAFMISALLVVIIVGIEGAVLGERSYALTQVAYQGARYAAVNPAYDPTTITNYVLQIAPAQIDQNSGAQLKVNVSPTSVPRVTGTPVTVTITYTFPHPLSFSPTLFGLSFPKHISATDVTMSE
jgi:Flp pilus assembly protein TadG